MTPGAATADGTHALAHAGAGYARQPDLRNGAHRLTSRRSLTATAPVWRWGPAAASGWEVLGLKVGRVRFLQRELDVVEQLTLVPGGPPTLGPPKTNRPSGRCRCRS